MNMIKDKEDKNEWRTPGNVFKLAEKLYGPFDIDLAATNENTLCEKYIDKAMNTFASSWIGHGWLNPPFSPYTSNGYKTTIKDWVRLIISCNTPITGVISAAVGNSWYYDLCLGCKDIIDIYPRIRYNKSSGIRGDSPAFGSSIFHYPGKNANKQKDPMVSKSTALHRPAQHMLHMDYIDKDMSAEEIWYFIHNKGK